MLNGKMTMDFEIISGTMFSKILREKRFSQGAYVVPWDFREKSNVLKVYDDS